MSDQSAESAAPLDVGRTLSLIKDDLELALRAPLSRVEIIGMALLRVDALLARIDGEAEGS